jgi:hypothetical protein
METELHWFRQCHCGPRSGMAPRQRASPGRLLVHYFIGSQIDNAGLIVRPVETDVVRHEQVGKGRHSTDHTWPQQASAARKTRCVATHRWPPQYSVIGLAVDVAAAHHGVDAAFGVQGMTPQTHPLVVQHARGASEDTARLVRPGC